MSKKRMSEEEEKRWRKIVFMDDGRGEKSSSRRPNAYVYGESTKQSWWQRLTQHFSRR